MPSKNCKTGIAQRLFQALGDSGFMPAYEPEAENQERKNLTVSVDGKSVRSTGKMRNYNGNAPHIVSAQLAEMGLTFAQETVESKSNEIPAVQALLKELDIRGCLVTADAMNCQTERTQSKKAFAHIMLDCLLDPYRLMQVISEN